MTGKFDLDARTFALGDRAAERFDQRLDVCEGDGRPRGLGEDRGERLSVPGVHGDTIAESAIVLRLAVKARAALSWTVLLHKALRLVAPGRISKQGDRYLRMLLTHGARSVLRAAAAARNAGKQVTGLRAWALAVQNRSNHNKACCALANKLARIAYACLRDHAAYDEEKPNSRLQALQTTEAEPAKGKKRSKARNAPKFDLRARLFKMCGVDLTRIDGIDVTTALVVVSEVGADMSKFPDDKHFASWLGLCPGTKITGGKVMSGKTARVANRAAQALKLAAAALRTSQSALGAYYRRLCARMDKPKAVTAAAHKLARLIYAMLTKGEEYTDRGQAYYEQRYRQRVVANLNRRAQQLGLQVVPIAAPA